MNEENQTIIKDHLPSGSTSKIAGKCNVSARYVRMVIDGQRNNEKVLTQALKLAKKEKIRKEKLAAELSELKN